MHVDRSHSQYRQTVFLISQIWMKSFLIQDVVLAFPAHVHSAWMLWHIQGIRTCIRFAIWAKGNTAQKEWVEWWCQGTTTQDKTIQGSTCHVRAWHVPRHPQPFARESRTRARLPKSSYWPIQCPFAISSALPLPCVTPTATFPVSLARYPDYSGGGIRCKNFFICQCCVSMYSTGLKCLLSDFWRNVKCRLWAGIIVNVCMSVSRHPVGILVLDRLSSMRSICTAWCIQESFQHCNSSNFVGAWFCQHISKR